MKSVKKLINILITSTIIIACSLFALSILANYHSQNQVSNNTLPRRLDDLGVNAKKQIKLNFSKKIVRSVESAVAIKTVPANQTIAKSTEIANKSALADISEAELELVSVFNSKLYKGAADPSLFNGSLQILDGDIASIEVSLPNGEELNINYSALSGNTFSYEVDGEDYRGTIFRSSGKNNNTVIVTLNGGPFENTTLKFTNPQSTNDSEQTRMMAANIDQLPRVVVSENFNFSDEELAQRHENNGFDFSI